MGVQDAVQLAINDYIILMSSGMPLQMAKMIAVQMSMAEQNIINAIIKTGIAIQKS